MRKVKNIGNQLKGYTEKLVFSFADITAYKRVKANMEHNNINYREFTVADMIQFASGLQELNKTWGYTLATCGEKIDIEKYGIVHNKCVDDDLMIKYFSDDARLMDYLGVEIQDANLFSGERTCAHLCEYRYANSSKEAALRNLQTHRQNPFAETIIGK